VLKVPNVQTWLVQKAASYLSRQLNVRVEVSKVDIQLFRKVILKDVFIQDQQLDTLVFIPDFEVKIGRLDFNEQHFILSELKMKKARIGVKHYKEPREYNMDFLIDYFSSTETDTTKKEPWKIKAEKIILEDCHLTYQDLKYVDVDHGIDWEDISVKKLNLVVENTIPEADTLNFDVSKISFIEKSGFKVNEFSVHARIQPGQMAFTSLKAKTDKSELDGEVVFNFNDMEDFENFIEDVKWKGDFNKSKIDFYDLSFFAKELMNINRSITLQGNFSGTVDRFKGKNVVLNYGNDTYFKGKVSMAGLPDFFETYIEVNVDQLSVSKKDIETIPAWPFDSLKLIQLPEQIGTLGKVKFNGSFNGFYNDFVAYGNIDTDLGFISSDLNLKLGSNDKQTRYKGNMVLNDFDIGRFWNLSDVLGKTTLKAKLEGKGFDLKNINANIEGEVASLELYKYNYSNIDLNGHFENKLFTGELLVNDPHLDLSFEGDIDFTKELPEFNFTSSVRKIDLTALNLLKRKNAASLSADLSISLVGSNIDNAQGIIEARDLTYTEGEKVINADLVNIESKLGEWRELSITSDFVDGKISGEYSFSILPQTIHHFTATYLPALLEENSVRPVAQIINFKAVLKETKELTSLFLPELSIAPGSAVEGVINTATNFLSLKVKSKSFEFTPVVFENFNVDGKTDASNFSFVSSFGEIQFNDSIRLKQVNLSGITNKDTASVRVQFNGKDSTLAKASFYINAGFLKTGYTVLKFVPDQLMLHGEQWGLTTSNYLLVDSTGFLFSDFNFTSGKQKISINGIAGRDTSAKMTAVFSDFEAGQFNDILSMYDVQIGGVTNGTAQIVNVLGKPAMNANLKVKDLLWFTDTLGDAEVNSVWDSRENKIMVNAIVTHGGDKNILINGAYVFKEKDDELDFTAKLNKTYVHSFSHYLDGLASDIGGVASGEVYLKGTAKKPELTGKLYLQKIGFKVDYLNTKYSFSTDVDILKDRFQFKNISLYDTKGNVSTVNGSIRHNHLSKFYFDFDIKANKAQVLNTGPLDNELYFGEAYASGSVSITGYLDYMIMDIGLRSEKGTKINIPLNNPDELSRSGFINFINRGLDTTVMVKRPDFTGIEMNMDFDVTQDAEMFLIFDSKIGDVIVGRGVGNITMSISPSEDLKILGNYRISEGKYLFTMQNIINKPFYILEGGTITWQGDPYDAKVDIEASYKLRAGLYDLFQDSSFRKLVPVDLNLRLTEKLFNPNITFNIKVQNVDPTIENQVRRLINTEEEKYRQAVSLLVMRRFTTPSEVSNRAIVNTSSVVGVNAYEMLSNQLSNWASQISKQVNVGVNYRPGDALTSEELEIAMSTSLFNDRVTIDGNVGVANTTTNSNNQNTSNLVGDFSVEVKANKEGSIRLKAFNRSNNNSLINNLNSPYTQGVGVFYSIEFNNFSEVSRRFKNLFKRKAKKQTANGILNEPSQKLN
jgi:TamB, inner membrane protein subunit of TAM complex